QNINAMQVHLGRWVDQNVPKTARVAVNDIGAIAFFSRREVIDLMGLVTPEIIPYRRQGEIGVIRYLKEACPQYVIIFPAWFPRLVASADTLEPLYRVRLERNEVAGAAEMVVYRLARRALCSLPAAERAAPGGLRSRRRAPGSRRRRGLPMGRRQRRASLRGRDRQRSRPLSLARDADGAEE